jgi:hypothetical protein
MYLYIVYCVAYCLIKLEYTITMYYKISYSYLRLEALDT